MRVFCVVALLITMLTGCSGTTKELERGMALRSALLAATECSFDAEITADYGDKLHEFAMACHGDHQGNLRFTVTKPETIAGITGEISTEGGKLTFDETALQFDLLADDQVTPVSAPWIFLKTLRSGYLTSAGEEEDLLRLTIDDSYEEDALQLDIWLNSENEPLRAEILYRDRRILSIDVVNFEIS